jgi:transcriptional regulator with XRE-family HTH domain
MEHDSPASLFVRQRLRDLRQQSGLSQEGVAERAEISWIYYQSIEAGRRRNVSLEILERIARAFQLSLVEFFSPKLPKIGLADDRISQPHKPRGKKTAKIRYSKGAPPKKKARPSSR